MKTYLLRVPADRAESIAKYVETTQSIIDFHRESHYPAIKACQRNIIEICDVFRSSLRMDAFQQAYKMYAALSCRAYQVLDDVYRDDPKSDVKNFTNIPVEHLNRCNTFLEHLRTELKDADNDFVSDEFKAVAVCEVQFRKFRTNVMDNLNLNAMKADMVGVVDSYAISFRA